MRLAVILAIYILLNAYVLFRSVRFLRRNLPENRRRIIPVAAAVVYIVMALTLPTALLMPQDGLQRFVQRIANCFNGLFLELLFLYVVVELAALLLRLIPKTRQWVRYAGPRKLLLGVVVWGISLSACVYGSIHAPQLKVVSYDVAVNKTCESMDSLRVALIADTHFGCNMDAEQAANMVEKVNAQQPDLILFAGDIFDNGVKGMDDPDGVKAALSGLQSRLGVYACWGNHDVFARLFSGFQALPFDEGVRGREMDDFVRDCGIIMLEDQAVLLEDAVWLIGRMDYENIGDGTRNRASIQELMEGVAQDKPVFVIDHEPRFLQESADAGVDVLFSGHTHDGQFFPLSIPVDSVWENPCGVLRKDNMTSVVTAGAGTYGPNMRIGTDADITVVNITFAGN